MLPGCESDEGRKRACLAMSVVAVCLSGSGNDTRKICRNKIGTTAACPTCRVRSIGASEKIWARQGWLIRIPQGLKTERGKSCKRLPPRCLGICSDEGPSFAIQPVAAGIPGVPLQSRTRKVESNAICCLQCRIMRGKKDVTLHIFWAMAATLIRSSTDRSRRCRIP